MKQSVEMTPFICAGCSQPIMERYLMKVLDKSWHVQCVKCSDCNSLLSEKCFSRDSKLYCRKDFFKRYGTKCAACNIGLCPEDLVRRAVNKVYHIHCFTCSLCRKQLSTGEQLYMVQGEQFLCERCYQVSVQSAQAVAKATPTVVATSGPAKPEPVKYATPSLPHSHEAHTPIATPTAGVQPQVGSNGKKHKPRTSINPHQLDVLLQAYSREQKPSKQMREELMAKTGLDMKVIQVWFQNRRSKEKRDASYREAMKEEASTPSAMQVPLLSAAAAVSPAVSTVSGVTLPSGVPPLGISSAESPVPLTSAGTTTAVLQ